MFICSIIIPMEHQAIDNLTIHLDKRNVTWLIQNFQFNTYCSRKRYFGIQSAKQMSQSLHRQSFTSL